MARSLYVVCYDTGSDRRRRRMVAILSRFGRRVQESVFEVLLDQTALGRLTRLLGPLIDPVTDSLIIYSASGTRLSYGVAVETLAGEAHSQVV